MNGLKCALIILLIFSGCSGNVADGTVEKTKAQEAKEALDNFRWDTAIELYLELIDEEPSEYSHQALIATAYAGRAGVDIFSIAGNKLTGSGSVLSKVQEFIPSDPTDEQLEDMRLSIEYLQSIPSADLSESDFIAISAQLSIYLTINSGMLINSFSSKTPTGQLDPEQLDQMTEEDAEEILSSLEAAAQSSTDPKFKAKVEGALAEIEASEGSTQEEKLKSFLQAQQAQ